MVVYAILLLIHVHTIGYFYQPLNILPVYYCYTPQPGPVYARNVVVIRLNVPQQTIKH